VGLKGEERGKREVAGSEVHPPARSGTFTLDLTHNNGGLLSPLTTATSEYVCVCESVCVCV